MARCNSCSAPLAADNNRCAYCGMRNDVDLYGKQEYLIHHQRSGRICPVCDKALHTIALTQQGTVFVERCDRCFGLFFEPEELEVFMHNAVSGVFDINLQQISNINHDRFRKQQPIRYVKCPQCRQMMNRVNFGYRSGVIVDRCRKHGVWLDSGEITHLLEWKKAGGQLLHEQYSQRKKARNRSQRAVLPDAYAVDGDVGRSSGIVDQDLLQTVARVIFRLFK